MIGEEGHAAPDAHERRKRLAAWIAERPAHDGLTATEIVDVDGGYLYQGHGRYDRCFDDLKALEREGLLWRGRGRPARWYWDAYTNGSRVEVHAPGALARSGGPGSTGSVAEGPSSKTTGDDR